MSLNTLIFLMLFSRTVVYFKDFNASKSFQIHQKTSMYFKISDGVSSNEIKVKPEVYPGIYPPG